MADAIKVTPELLADLTSKANAATPGPWESAWDHPAQKPVECEDEWTIRRVGTDDLKGTVCGVMYYDGHHAGCTKPNAAYIAALHPAVALALVARIRELEAAALVARRAMDRVVSRAGYGDDDSLRRAMQTIHEARVGWAPGTSEEDTRNG